MHRGGEIWESGSNYFYILSTVVTFVIPVLLLVLPWFALLVQVRSLSINNYDYSKQLKLLKRG